VGAGLGLWLGHNLAQRLGGTLSVQTVNDHVEFKLCLPLTTPP
jgi:nitrogen-specific signal transduction histidine kinase